MFKPIARAIDVGHGNTKYTRVESGSTKHGEFPSVAVLAQAGEVDPKSPFVQRAKTLIVEAAGNLYYVGPDAPGLQSHVGGRALDPAFARSAVYCALMKAGLAHIDEPVIDVLGLGLPLTTYRLQSDQLRRSWTGVVEVPDISNPGQTRRVEIRQVLAVPQPIGAFVAAMKEGWIRPTRGNVLIADPGYYTLDWVVITPDRSILHARSGAYQGGVAAVVRQLSAALEREVQRPIEKPTAIEVALREGAPITLYGREYSMAPYQNQIDAVVDAMVGDMVHRLGDYSDLRQVVVAGGGGPLFKNAIQRKLGIPTSVLPDPEFANLRGFLAMAESIALRGSETAA